MLTDVLGEYWPLFAGLFLGTFIFGLGREYLINAAGPEETTAEAIDRLERELGMGVYRDDES